MFIGQSWLLQNYHDHLTKHLSDDLRKNNAMFATGGQIRLLVALVARALVSVRLSTRAVRRITLIHLFQGTVERAVRQ